jgi:hypothetical protein
VVAVPTPDDQRTLPNPITVGLRVVAGSQPRGWAWPRALAGTVRRFVRDSLLIVAAFASITVAAFRLHEIAGWFVLGLSLLVIDLMRRGEKPADGGSP